MLKGEWIGKERVTMAGVGKRCVDCGGGGSEVACLGMMGLHMGEV